MPRRARRARWPLRQSWPGWDGRLSRGLLGMRWVVVMLVLPDAVLYQEVVGARAEPSRGERGERGCPAGDLASQLLAERQRGREPRAVAAAGDPQARHAGHRAEHEPPVRAHREHAAAVLADRTLRGRHLAADLL